nr:immunoglobulin-like and fibronectin type III domain-containing protein 1 isoform X2 [Petromyzon marinus]
MLRKPPVIISDVQPSKDGVSNKSLAPPKDKARRKQSFTLNMVAYTHHTEEGTVPEGQSVPEFLSKPYSLTLMEGKSATFRARVSGTPTPTVTWQRINGEPVVSGSDYKVHYDQRKDEHIMEVPKVLSKFADTYRCTASNVHAEASIAVALIAISLRKSAPLQMKEEVSDAADFRAKLKKRVEEEKVPEKTFDEKEVWDILMSADRKDYEAICFKYGIKDFRGMLRRLQAMKEAKEEEEENELQLRKALKHVKVNAEGTAVFEIYMGRLDPSKNLRFFKNGRLLTIDETEGKHMLKKIDDKYCLVINNVNANDDGDYAVEVDGQMIKAGHLHYTDEQVFIRQLQSMRCYERESVTFECKLTMPTPTATWNFKSLELIESNKYEMKVLDGGKTHQLTINNTRMVDKGVYSIVVFGCSSVAWLEVAKSAIKFKSGFRSVRARAGDTASFSSELNIEGTNATWLKDKLPITASDIDSGRIKVFSDGGKHGISFHPAAEKDTGEYTVVVKQDDDDKEYTANTFLRVEAADDDANKKERQERRTQKAMVAPPKSTGDGGKRGDDKSTSGKGGKGDGSKSGLDKSADAGKGLKGNAGLDDGSRKKIPPPPVIMIEPVDGNNVGNGFGNGGSGDGSDLLDKSGSGDGGDGSGLGDGADLSHQRGTGDEDSGRNRRDADSNAAPPRKRQPAKQPVDLSHLRGTGDEDSGRNGRDADSSAAPPRKGQPAKQPVDHGHQRGTGDEDSGRNGRDADSSAAPPRKGQPAKRPVDLSHQRGIGDEDSGRDRRDSDSNAAPSRKGQPAKQPVDLSHQRGTGDEDSGRDGRDSDSNAAPPRKGQPAKQPVDLSHQRGTGDEDSGRDGRDSDSNAAPPRKGQPAKQPVDLSHQRGTGDEDSGRDGRDSDSNAAPPRKGQPAKQPVDLSHQRGTGDEDSGRDGRDSDSNAAPPRKGQPAKQPVDLSHQRGTGDEDTGRDGRDSDSNAAPPRKGKPAKQPVGLDGLGSGTGDGGKGDGLDGLDNSGSDGKSGLVDRLADGDDDDSDADESEFADRRHDAVGMDLSHLHGTGDEDSGRNGLDADPNAALPRNRQPAKQPVARKSRFADIDTSLKELEPSNRKPRVQEEAGPEYIVAEPPVIDEDARAKLERDPITVRAGQTALVSVPFSCKGTSCSATWTRDDGATEVREDERTHLERSDRDATFTLSRCKRGDSGDLKLQLKSPMGTAEINMQLEVIDKPSLPVGPLETSVAGKLVTMTWQPPLDDGGRPVSRYLVERRQADKRSWVPVGDAAGDAASFKTDKVDEGKAYQFRVRAVNSEGESDALESGTVTIEKQATPPSAPGSPRATNVTKNTVSLMWTEPKNTGGAPVASYVLEKRNRGTVAWSYASTSAIYDTQHTVKGLDEGTWYEFRVTAVNSAGRSEPSAVSQPALPKEPLKCPGSVHGLAVSKLAAQGFTLSWKPPVDGGDPEGYIVETCPEGSSEWTRANKALATQPSYTVGGIHDRRMYFVRVTAVNETGLGKPTQLDTCVSAAPPSVRPSFKLDSSTSSYMRVKAGNTVRLKVLFTGSPAPEADWLKEGVRLSTRVAITSTSGSSQMLIPCAALKDSGHYTLVISNEAGSETHSIFMKVIDVPSSPGHVSLVEKVPGTVTVCWSASRDEVTDDELTYTVLRREVNNKVWTEIGDHINNNSFTVTDSVTGQPYMFRVVAVNSVGRSYPSESKEPWSLMRRREPVGLVMPRYRGWNEASAPAFLVPLRSHVVTRGTECRMSCAVRGCPRPIVTWFKGGQSLWGSQRACPTETVGVCSLLLPVVDFEDAGMYTVHAQNPHGKTECSASLDVKDCSVD